MMKKALLVIVVIFFVCAVPLSVSAEPNHGNGHSWCFGWGFFWHHFGCGWHWNNPPAAPHDPPVPPAQPADPKGDGGGKG
jgi:hypothetical protein